MTRKIALLIAASAAIATPVLAFQAQGEQEAAQPSILDRVLDRFLGPAEQPQAEPVATSPAAPTGLSAVLAADYRADDRARDRYRHPAETLAFMGVEPDMTVLEVGPGINGWYAKILIPYIALTGNYYGSNPGPSGRDLTDEQRARAAQFGDRFRSEGEALLGVDRERINYVWSDDYTEEMNGTFDRVLLFRVLHGMRNGDVLLRELRRYRQLLADDGMIGVVQHRAPESETWERSNGSRAYLRQSDVIALFELAGFELAASSEINANLNDPADHDVGVWVLPPTLTRGDEDRDRYVAIGESDRMTLLFRKAN